jgi:methionyl aminopeptidase
MANKKTTTTKTQSSRKLTTEDFHKLYNEETGKDAIWRGKESGVYLKWLEKKKKELETQPINKNPTTKKPPTAKKLTVRESVKKTSKKTVKKTVSKKTSTKKSVPKKTEEQIQEEKERIDAYKKAGDISKKVKEFIRPKIKPGVKLIELVDLAEKKIVELGGKPGFPVNISINNIAAHYTPPPGDTSEIQEGDIVKFDHGVHIDGYCVDTAFTVSLNNEPSLKNLVKASEEAVNNAIKKIKHGVTTNVLGETIEQTVRNYGYKPIIDLHGHKIERWDVHGGKSIPSIAQPKGDVMEDGEIYAVEVFVSNGEGTIHARQSNEQIFQINPTVRKIPLRTKSAKKILGYVLHEFQTLPFSRYQVFQEFPQGTFGLYELIKTNKLEKHQILAEKKGFFIAQTEHTVLVTKSGSKILT